MKRQFFAGSIILLTCISIASAEGINWNTYKELKSDADIDFSNVVEGSTYIATGGKYDKVGLEISGKQYNAYNQDNHQSKIAFEYYSSLLYHYLDQDINPFAHYSANSYLLDTHAWTVGGSTGVNTGIFTIKDLEVGKSYRIQFIAPADLREGEKDRTYRLDDETTEFGRYYDHDGDGERNTSLVIGEFTADSTTQDFRLTSLDDTGIAYSAIILSEIDVPEPATMLLLTGGLAGLITRRRKKSA